MELGVAMIYARGLFDAAKDLDMVDEIREELGVVGSAIREEPDFSSILMNPAVSAKKKHEMLESIFSGRVHEELLSFLFILVDNKRAYALHDITRQYNKLVDDMEGVGEGEIYSVEKLTDEQLSKFEEETGKLIGKNVKLSNILDPNVIGGIKILIEDKLIDATFRRQLDRLGEKIKRA